MVSTVFSRPKVTPVSGSGAPYAGSKYYFYASGTSTLQSVFTDEALTIPHANPVVADANGTFPVIWLDQEKSYRAKLTTAAGVLLEDVDPVNSFEYVDALAFKVAAEEAQAAAEAANNAAQIAMANAQSAQAGSISARDAAFLSKGVFPTTAAGIGYGVAGSGVITGGSSGTNGTFDLAFTGGTGSGAAGRFVVASGALTAIIITAPGSYTVAPTFSFAASSGLTGASATCVLGRNADVGEYFSVPVSGSGDSLILYRVDAGPVATEITRYPSATSISDLSEVLTGPLKAMVNSSYTAALSRGTYTAYDTTINATIFGWRSPFSHNGSAFNALQLTFRSNTTAVFRVEILDSSLNVLAYGQCEANTSYTTHLVPLNRTVRELAASAIGYVQYYNVAKTAQAGYPAGGAYAVGDANPAVYLEKYYAAGGWGTALPAGNYRINFRAVNTNAQSRNFADEITAVQAVTSVAVTKNAANQIRNAYSPYAVWQSVLGDSEMAGDLDYSFASVLGCYEQMTETTVFNGVKWRIWKEPSSGSVDIEWKVWIRDTAAAFNMLSVAADASGTIAAANFPTTNTEYTLRLTTPLLAASGKYVFVAFRAVDHSYLFIRRWAYNASISPARHQFILSGTTPGWNHTVAFSSPASGYGATAPKFLMESEEIRSTGAIGPATSISFSGSPSGISATNVQTAIAEIAGTEIVLPQNIFGVQGREANVYLDNLFLDDSSDYLISVSSSSSLGTQQNERWTWTPVGAVTSGTLTISASQKKSGVQITTKTATHLAAASSAGSGLTKKVIVIGDSLIAAGTITQTLIDVAATDVMGVTMLGTQGSGSNKHEGRGGWTVSTYTTNYAGNPFWIGGTVDFSGYLSTNGIATPDWVFIALGINDVFSQTSDTGALSAITTAFTGLNTLITSIKAAGASIKVGLVIPPPPSTDQDSFGANYGVTARRWRFKRNILLWARQLISTYSGQEASRIYVVPSNTALDTVNNMSRATAAGVNSRNSSVTVARQNNGVHPATSGYQQIGDAWWAFLKYYA